MSNVFKEYWQGLQPRERLILGLGGVLVFLIFFYALIWQPWHKAISFMETSVQPMRENLVWMRQQADLINSGGGLASERKYKGSKKSLLSVIEQTAKQTQVRSFIQQMVPAQDKKEVRVILEEANFNQWVRWVDVLFKQYGVNIKQVSAESDGEEPNIAEIRVTFIRV